LNDSARLEELGWAAGAERVTGVPDVQRELGQREDAESQVEGTHVDGDVVVGDGFRGDVVEIGVREAARGGGAGVAGEGGFVSGARA
jgi:hypothetical protein